MFMRTSPTKTRHHASRGPRSVLSLSLSLSVLASPPPFSDAAFLSGRPDFVSLPGNLKKHQAKFDCIHKEPDEFVPEGTHAAWLLSMAGVECSKSERPGSRRHGQAAHIAAVDGIPACSRQVREGDNRGHTPWLSGAATPRSRGDGHGHGHAPRQPAAPRPQGRWRRRRLPLLRHWKGVRPGGLGCTR